MNPPEQLTCDWYRLVLRSIHTEEPAARFSLSSSVNHDRLRSDMARLVPIGNDIIGTLVRSKSGQEHVRLSLIRRNLLPAQRDPRTGSLMVSTQRDNGIWVDDAAAFVYHAADDHIGIVRTAESAPTFEAIEKWLVDSCPPDRPFPYAIVPVIDPSRLRRLQKYRFIVSGELGCSKLGPFGYLLNVGRIPIIEAKFAVRRRPWIGDRLRPLVRCTVPRPLRDAKFEQAMLNLVISRSQVELPESVLDAELFDEWLPDRVESLYGAVFGAAPLVKQMIKVSSVS